MKILLILQILERGPPLGRANLMGGPAEGMIGIAVWSIDQAAVLLGPMKRSGAMVRSRPEKILPPLYNGSVFGRHR